MDNNQAKDRKSPQWLKKITSSSNLGIFIALVIMVLVFTIMKRSYFSYQNIMNILVSCSVVGLVAIGESYLMIAGQIDLAPGSISAFSGVLVALLLKAGWAITPAVLLTLLVGALAGAINAVLINHVLKGCHKMGIKYAETGPQLETNEKVQNQWMFFSTRQHKRRRCFVKQLV